MALGSRGAHCFGGENGDGDVNKKADVDMSASLKNGGVFGVEWSSTGIKFYHDGVLALSLTTADPVFACLNQPMNVIFSTEVADSSVPDALTSTAMKATYFRYWTSKESVVTDTTADTEPDTGSTNPGTNPGTNTSVNKTEVPPGTSATSHLGTSLAVFLCVGLAAMLD